MTTKLLSVLLLITVLNINHLKAENKTDTEELNTTIFDNAKLTEQKSEIASVSIDSIEKGEYSTINNTENDYRKILFLKLNKNKGYRTQDFEDQNKYALLEKGVSYFSFNLGFKDNTLDNLWLEPIATIDNMYNRNFNISLSAGYFIRNNLAIGFKAGYSFQDIRIALNADILDIVISAKSYETNNASTTFSGSFLIKNFIPIDRAHRLFLINETGLVYSNTQSLSKNIYDTGNKVHKIEKDKNTFGIGISPGFMYFMTKGFAFEFSMNPVIAYFEKTNITNNLVEKGNNTSYGLNMKFLPFNIQFGFAYYFGLDYLKNRAYIANLKK